jgi:hypothetical protein
LRVLPVNDHLPALFESSHYFQPLRCRDLIRHTPGTPCLPTTPTLWVWGTIGSARCQTASRSTATYAAVTARSTLSTALTTPVPFSGNRKASTAPPLRSVPRDTALTVCHLPIPDSPELAILMLAMLTSSDLLCGEPGCPKMGLYIHNTTGEYIRWYCPKRTTPFYSHP